MSLEQTVADLVTATTQLTDAINVKKADLDTASNTAVQSASAAAASASTASAAAVEAVAAAAQASEVSGLDTVEEAIDYALPDALAKADPARHPFRGKLPSLALEFSKNRYHLVGDYGLEPQQITDVLTVSNGASTRVDHRGQIVPTAVNQPVIDYDPATGECRGLSTQAARTNLFLRSEEYDHAYWTKRSGSGIQSNAVIAPDGTLTGDRHYNTDTTTSGSYVRRIEPLTINQVYTISVFVRKGTESTTRITLYTYEGSNTRNSCQFNFDTESIVMDVSQVGTPSCGFEKYKYGWYRIWLTSTSGLIQNSANCIIDFGGGWTLPSSIDTHWVYLWGSQLEAGSFPSRYTKTEGSTVARVSDYPTVDNQKFTPAFNPHGFTVLVEYDAQPEVADSTLLAMDDGNTDQTKALDLRFSSTQLRLRMLNSGVQPFPEINFGGSATNGTGRHKVAFYVSPTAINTAIDGVGYQAIPTQDILAVTTLFNRLRLGHRGALSGTQRLVGSFYSVTLFSHPMTLAEVEELTA